MQAPENAFILPKPAGKCKKYMNSLWISGQSPEDHV